VSPSITPEIDRVLCVVADAKAALIVARLLEPADRGSQIISLVKAIAEARSLARLCGVLPAFLEIELAACEDGLAQLKGASA
jgi:hypothetical protein